MPLQVCETVKALELLSSDNKPHRGLLSVLWLWLAQGHEISQSSIRDQAFIALSLAYNVDVAHSILICFDACMRIYIGLGNELMDVQVYSLICD